MSRKALKARVEALQALHSSSHSPESRNELTKALRDRNNYLVSRAATIAADVRAEELIPELVAAFDRFMIDAEKSDPQCLAKVAIAKALKDLEHHDPDVYRRGIAHFQFEPAWGGPADTAAELRATCALALAACHLADLEILTYLTDGLADPDTLVRVNSAIAIDALNRPEGALLLRLKLLMGDREPDVLAQCFASILSLAPKESVEFVARFLRSDGADVQLEAAGALAQCREPEALEVLKEFWQAPLVAPEVRRLVLINLGASPLPEAAEFLLAVVASASTDLAKTALTALAASRFQVEMRDRIRAVLEAKADPTLKATFASTIG